MERTSTFQTGLIIAALLVVVAAIGLVLLAPALDKVTLPASKAQVTEREMEEAWESLVDAIQREDQVEALRVAEWLDEQHGLKTHATEVVQDWCRHKGQEWDFCKETDNAE